MSSQSPTPSPTKLSKPSKRKSSEIEAYSPEDVKRLTPSVMHKYHVIEVVNELLLQSRTIYQDTIVQKLIQRNVGDKDQKECLRFRAFIFKEHLLDFEDVYRNKGWNVKYDKPAYNESYEPTWTFTPK